MTAHGVAVAALLAMAAVVVVLCAAGVATAPTVYDRIHLVGPAAMVAPPLVAAAVVTQEGLSPLGIKAMLVVVVLWITGPVLTHATARVAAIRERGHWVAGDAGDAGDTEPTR